jgi:uncharacterized protein YcbK (DUF882 family)
MKYFELTEFDSPDEVGSGENMSHRLLIMLDKARELACVSFVITSGYRTKSHNDRVGGSKTSSHMKGAAVDISCTSSTARYAIIAALMASGFNRIGIAKTFIHCDIDDSKPKNLIWTY